MGIKYKFTCSYCVYQVVTSGGADSGLKSLTDTIYCKDCDSISDVKIRDGIKANWTAPTLEKKLINNVSIIHHDDVSLPLVCPQCESINTELWDGTCPKCKRLMVCGEAVVFWD